MRITVLFFGPARLLVGTGRQILEAPANATVLDAATILFREHPRLRTLESCLRYAIETEYADPSDVLKEGQTLALIPPVQGG